eukprot:scaffold81736_cov29-Tisochrysis_lutea.AAC.2
MAIALNFGGNVDGMLTVAIFACVGKRLLGYELCDVYVHAHIHDAVINAVGAEQSLHPVLQVALHRTRGVFTGFKL